MFCSSLSVSLALVVLASGCVAARSGSPAGPVAHEASPRRAAGADSAERDRAAAVRADDEPRTPPPDSRIGTNDLLEVVVLESPELKRSVRVAANGMISLPLVNEVRAAGLTSRELELALESRLRDGYIRDPHVSVHISEMQGHAVSILGAVARPGVVQLRDARSLLEVIALAGGLTKEAGESVLVTRGDASPGPAALEIPLKALLESGDSRQNVAIYPGDVVRVKPAGMIYVVGEVRRPGAFALADRSGLTVLQAIAMGEGLAPRAAKGRTVIIRTAETGERSEIRVDIGDVVAGRAVDPQLQPKDVVFVPNSATKSVTLGVVDALMRMVTLRGVF